MSAEGAWTVPPEHRPTCPLSGQPCTSWTCLVDVCEGPMGNYRAVKRKVESDLVREVLEALARRNGVSLESRAEPGTPARNYELALRLGVGQVFGLDEPEAEPS